MKLPKPIHYLAGLCLLLSCLVASPAIAEKVYKSLDARGRVVYSDKPVAQGRVVEVAQVEKDAPDRRMFLRVKGDRDDAILAAVNNYFGPVEVEILLTKMNNVLSDTSFPARYVVPARTELETVRVWQNVESAGFSYRYGFRYILGDPSAEHRPERPYRLPVPAGRTFEISQAFNGEVTHNKDDYNRYAVDIPMTEGTPVHAARAGVIMDFANDFFNRGAADESLESKANYVVVLHDDGTMAVYVHLKLETLQFPLGTRVERGQFIAESGNTGYSTGPHLHFAIIRNNGMSSVSIPFQFEGAGGIGYTPEEGMMVAVDRH